MELKRIKISYAAPVILFFIAILYVFITYSSWLTSSCIAPLGADIKFHVATVSSFVEQIKQYGFIYPVEYLQDISGFYWYIRGLIPILVPGLLAFVLPFNTAFFLVFMLVYVFLTLVMYFFVKNLTDEYIGFLFGIFFLFSNLSNMIFSVGGNYQFFFGLLFFLLAMTFLFKYTHHPTKKNLLFLSLSVLALGMIYIFSLVFFVSFMFLYGIMQKKWHLLKIALILVLALSFFLIPTFLTGSYLKTDASTNFYSPSQFFKLYVLPSTPFSWIYHPRTEYHGQLDFNQGIHVHIAGILAAGFLLLKRRRLESSRFVLIYLIVMVGWVTLAFMSRVLPFLFLKSFFVNSLPTERLMMHVAFAFLFVIAVALSQLSIHWRSFIGAGIAGLLVLGTSVFSNKFFFAAVGIAVIFGLKEVVKKEKLHHGHVILSGILILLLLFPLTGKVENTNLDPRPAYFIVDDAKNFIAPEDVFFFTGGWSLQETILSCTKAHSIVQIDRDGAISGLSGDIDMLNPDIATKETLESRGVTKILIVLDQILENGKINEQKVAHLVKWFGQPKAIQPKMQTKEKLQDYYPILVFDVPKKERDYETEMISPRKIKINNLQDKENLLINIEYHPWWKAKDFSSKEQVEIKNKEGLIELNNIKNHDSIILIFSLRYFVIGGIISLASLFFLIRILRRRGS